MSAVRALLIDIGNTRLKWGVLAEDRIGKTGGVSHEKLQATGYAALTSRIPRNLTHVMISNVAGSSVGTKITGVIGLHGDADVRFARCERTAFGVTNGYRQFRRMSVDRWVAIVGAWNEFRTSLCVVDAGTAITIDAVDKTGLHRGGQIIPGIRRMEESLLGQAGGAPAVSRGSKDPDDGMGLFGKTTRDAVTYGALTAVCGAVELAAARMRGEGLRPKIVLTGGDATRILKQLKSNVIHRPNLVLQGLSIMVQDDA